MTGWRGLLRADLQRTLVSPDALAGMVLFGVLVLVLVHFALPPAQGRSISVGTAALWVAVLFSGVIGLPSLQHHPGMVRVLPQLLTSPVSSGQFFLAKFLVGYAMLAVSVGVLFPLAVVLFGLPLRWHLLGSLGLLMVGLLGACAVLTVCAMLTVGRQPWLFPVLAFPLLFPVVLLGPRVTEALLIPERPFPWLWFRPLLAYDGVMVLGGWFLAEFLWEELPH